MIMNQVDVYALRNVIVDILVIKYIELHVLIREVKGCNDLT
jgi:hypothetical protein